MATHQDQSTMALEARCAYLVDCERLAQTLLQHLIQTHYLRDKLPAYPADLQFQLLGLSQTLNKIHSWLEQFPALFTEEHVATFQAHLDSCSLVTEEFGKELGEPHAVGATNDEKKNWGEVFHTYELKFHPHVLSFYVYLQAVRCATPEDTTKTLNRVLPDPLLLDDNQSSLTGDTLAGVLREPKADDLDDEKYSGFEKVTVSSAPKPKFCIGSLRQQNRRKSMKDRTVTRLFFRTINIFYPSKGPTALHKACEKGSKFHVRRLLFNGADIHAKDVSKKSPLHKAVAYSQPEITSILLESGANVDAHDDCGSTPLHQAAASVYKPCGIDIMRNLLEFKANPNLTDDFGKTPLHVAASVSHYASPMFMTMLLNSGADTECEDKILDKPLHYATRANALKNINTLLAAGANINSKNLQHQTALHIAVENQHNSAVNSLIQAGADVNAIDVRWTSALDQAAGLGNVSCVKTLTSAGANMEPEVTLLHQPLHTAVMFNKPDVVKVLLELGTDPNPRGRFGQTPLTLACQDGWLDCAKLLLEFGADPKLEQGSPRGIVSGNALACARLWNRCPELTRMLEDLEGVERNEGLKKGEPKEPRVGIPTGIWIGKFVVQVYERNGSI